MINNSTNIDKTNNKLSRQIIEHKTTMTYGIWNPCHPALGQANMFQIYQIHTDRPQT